MQKYDHLLIIPLSGQGSRFANIGVKCLKQTLAFDDGSYPVNLSMASIKNLETCYIIFTVQKESHRIEIETALIELENFKALSYEFVITGETGSAVETVDRAMQNMKRALEDTAAVTICTMDIQLINPIELQNQIDLTYTFKASTGPYSYVTKNDQEELICAEKKSISSEANAGIYTVSSVEKLRKCLADKLSSTSNEEHSIAECLINSKHTNFETKDVKEIYIFGTPREWVYYNAHILPRLRTIEKKEVLLVCDHSAISFGYKLKETLKTNNYQVTHIENNANLPWNEVIHNHKNEIKHAFDEEYLILASCLSGQGMANALTKLLGLHVPVVSGIEHLRLAFAHSNSRVLSLSALHCEQKEFIARVHTELSTFFEGGRHQERQISNGESLNYFSNIGDVSAAKKGWFIGDFDPSIYKNADFEIGIKRFDDALDAPDLHYHTSGHEITVLLNGNLKNANGHFGPGAISVQEPLQPDTNSFTKNSQILCVRLNGKGNQKRYYDK